MEEDINQIAARIRAESTGEPQTTTKKNAAAVELGRLGGLKGGKARAAKLSARRRKLIAQKAAASRWRRKKQET
jgi:hypothetical protein